MRGIGDYCLYVENSISVTSWGVFGLGKIMKVVEHRWFCYAATLIIFLGILIWGLSGVFGGGGRTYRLFNLYVLIPGVSVIVGIVPGIFNQQRKWLYPVFAGLLAYIVVIILYWQPSAMLFGLSYAFFPLMAGFIGLGVGVFIFRMRAENKMRLKRVTKAFLAVGFIIGLVHAVHAFTLDRIIVYNEVIFYSDRVGPGLDGYRIAFIVDVHYISEGRLRAVVEELNERQIDLVVLGGDFAMVQAHMRRTIEILSYIETVDGFFGVEGNHDNYVHLFAAMRARGMVPLSNQGVNVRDGLFLAGVEDLWNRNPDIARAIEGAGDEDFVLLVTHNPDVAMQQDTSGVDLILGGHTHGGQVNFFGVWAPYFTFTRGLTAYGQRFSGGWASAHDNTPVFVSRGVGEYLPRVFARPEVVIITLVADR